MLFRLARAGHRGRRMAAAIAAAELPQPALAQSPAQAPTQPHKSRAGRAGQARRPPAAPEQIAPQRTPPQPGDAFGEDTTLTAKPMVYVKGTGTWDKAFETISDFVQEDQSLSR